MSVIIVLVCCLVPMTSASENEPAHHSEVPREFAQTHRNALRWLLVCPSDHGEDKDNFQKKHVQKRSKCKTQTDLILDRGSLGPSTSKAPKNGLLLRFEMHNHAFTTWLIKSMISWIPTPSPNKCLCLLLCSCLFHDVLKTTWPSTHVQGCNGRIYCYNYRSPQQNMAVKQLVDDIFCYRCLFFVFMMSRHPTWHSRPPSPCSPADSGPIQQATLCSIKAIHGSRKVGWLIPHEPKQKQLSQLYTDFAKQMGSRPHAREALV